MMIPVWSGLVQNVEIKIRVKQHTKRESRPSNGKVRIFGECLVFPGVGALSRGYLGVRSCRGETKTENVGSGIPSRTLKCNSVNRTRKLLKFGRSVVCKQVRVFRGCLHRIRTC